MITFNEIIQDAENFQSFVTELAPAFRDPKFPQYTEDTYSETRDWKAVVATIGRIPMASLIDPYSGKPLIGTEKPLDINGEMPTFGNKVTFSSKEFNRIESIERGIEKNVANSAQLIRYLNQYFERLVVGPLITQDKLFFEALSNGTSTILAADNLSKLSMSLDWNLDKSYVSTTWATSASATGLDDLKALFKRMKDTYGVILEKFIMNSNTLALLQAQASTKAAITSYFSEGGTTTKFMGTPSKDAINKVLVNGMLLPPIELEDYMVSTYNSDGITIKKTEPAFLDGRVSGVVGDVYAQYIWTPADEQRRQDADAIYQDINHVLISKRQNRGKVTFESELNSIIVPNLMDSIGILVTDATS